MVALNRFGMLSSITPSAVESSTQIGTPDMKHFIIEVAEVRIRINVLSSGTYAYCIRYLSDGEPDIVVDVTAKDVLHEIETSGQVDSCLNVPYLETVAVYRKVAEVVANFGLVLMHGAVVGLGSDAYMFSAPSGTGKTTHIRKWLENLDDAYVINGDKPLIRVGESATIAYGTPWCGKERLGTNAAATLRAIAFLERGDENCLEELSFEEAYPLLLRHAHLPSDINQVVETLNLLSQMRESVRFLRFQCNNFKDDCFDVAYNALIGKTRTIRDS